jgi:hypothetical protein
MIAALKRDYKVASTYGLLAVVTLAIIVITRLTILDETHKNHDENHVDHYLTIAAIMQSCAIALLVMKVQINDLAGLSPAMLWCYALAYGLRQFTLMFWVGYAPADFTGNSGLYRVSELFVVAVCVYCLHVLRKARDQAWQIGEGIHEEHPLLLPVMVGGCLLLAFPTMTNWHRNFAGDLIWMASQWLEPIAIIPQLYLVTQKKEVERRTSHFIALMIMSRLLTAIFWGVLLRLLWHVADSGFLFAIVTQNIMSVVLSVDYLYYWAKTIRAPSMILPVS